MSVKDELSCAFSENHHFKIQNASHSREFIHASTPRPPISGGAYLRTKFTWNGPTVLHMYIKTRLDTDGATFCLSFWYHMKGNDCGKLQVYWASDDGDPNWSRVGNLGDKWHHGQLERKMETSRALVSIQIPIHILILSLLHLDLPVKLCEYTDRQT